VVAGVGEGERRAQAADAGADDDNIESFHYEAAFPVRRRLLLLARDGAFGGSGVSSGSKRKSSAS
jgi:hypothetical protein